MWGGVQHAPQMWRKVVAVGIWGGIKTGWSPLVRHEIRLLPPLVSLLCHCSPAPSLIRSVTMQKPRAPSQFRRRTARLVNRLCARRCALLRRWATREIMYISYLSDLAPESAPSPPPARLCFLPPGLIALPPLRRLPRQWRSSVGCSLSLRTSFCAF